ncbi:TPA: hypothetical protein ACP7HF_002148 [Yersinia enterocolitica]
MVSFSNTDDAHCDSVNGQSTMPSETVQMNVKIPVQPSNFDALQMGALLGAPGFMKHGKNHTYQINNKTKSIPSPGTIFKETSLIAGFLLSGIWALQTELAPTKPPPTAFSFNRLSLFTPSPLMTHSTIATPCVTNAAN